MGSSCGTAPSLSLFAFRLFQAALRHFFTDIRAANRSSRFLPGELWVRAAQNKVCQTYTRYQELSLV